WSGGTNSEKFQKTIDMRRVKSEMGYSASDYFAMVFEHLSARPGINLDDLAGTELEEAETVLFRDALAESLRATMWMGSVNRAGGYHDTFDGVLSHILEDNSAAQAEIPGSTLTDAEYNDPDAGETILKKVWNNASVELRSLKAEGNLVFFVTSDIYSRYEESLDSAAIESAYVARQEGRPSLLWRGIPIVDMQVSGYLAEAGDMPKTWAILTDRRNLALAINTADFPGTEVRMWYNPDEMQNRQRAVFAAGCNYLLPELISYAFKA
ncbi:MAG: hypothetical protein LBU97_04100, partial [Alistipes sp.]|nr:hypothetical protein [Alistipes sp.]